MRNRFMTLVAIFGMSAAGPLLAHHSFAAEYDQAKPITLKGVVTKIDWANPHIFFYIDVKDSSGKTVNWGFEGGSPNSLFREGWKRDSLKVGDLVSVDGYRAKDRSNLANARSVKLHDGREVFAGSSTDGGPLK